MKNQKGFTLIELVMVILLLGILAAVAIPRFWDLGSRADQAAGDGGIGGIKSGVAIYNASRRTLGAAPYYPVNPLIGDVVSDLYSRAGDSTCASLSQGQWGVDNSAVATNIYYRWRSSSLAYSAWSYASSSGIISPVRADVITACP